MESKSIEILPNNYHSIDKLVEVYSNFNWVLVEKIVCTNPTCIKMNFKREISCLELINYEKEYILLQEEKEKLFLKSDNILKNSEHVTSKCIIFILLVIFVLFLSFLLSFNIFFDVFDLFNKIAGVCLIVLQVLFLYRLYFLFFISTREKINTILSKIKVIDMKQSNIIYDINNI